MEGHVKRRTLRSWFLVLFIATAIVGCSADTYSEVIDFEDERWSRGENAVFQFLPYPDYKLSEISILIRTNVYYIGSDLRLVVKTIDPNANFWEDTVLIPISHSKHFNTSRLVVRSGIRWGVEGIYSISLRPLQDLTGIQAVGVNVTNARDKINY